MLIALALLVAADCSPKNPLVAHALKGGYAKSAAAVPMITYYVLPVEGSLAGIECFGGLESLDAADRKLTDVRPLAGLSKLKVLRLRNNQLKSVAPLAGLVALETLDLGDNQIADVSPLTSLARLKELRLENNQIVDVAALGKLAELEELNLDRNRIADARPLLALKKLSTLNLDRNTIADVPALRKAGLAISEYSHQYKGSCAPILARAKEGKPAQAQFAICPPWEDAQTAPFAPRGGHCRVERICNGLVGVDCNSAIDGPYDYFELGTWKLVANCGGACMGGRCTNCPPKEMACPRY